MKNKQPKKSSPMLIYLDHNALACRWYWVFKDHRGHIVCRSVNSENSFDGYTRKDTTIRSAKRFVEKYFKGRHVVIVDENNKTIKEYNGFYDPVAEDLLL